MDGQAEFEVTLTLKQEFRPGTYLEVRGVGMRVVQYLGDGKHRMRVTAPQETPAGNRAFRRRAAAVNRRQ